MCTMSMDNTRHATPKGEHKPNSRWRVMLKQASTCGTRREL